MDFTNEKFINCFKSGQIILAKQLYKTKQIDLDKYQYHCFQHACGNNNVEMARYLLSICDVDYTFNDHKCIIDSHINGNYEISKFLESLYSTNDWTFGLYCQTGHTEYVKRMMSDKSLEKDIFYLGFRLACKGDNIEIAKKLYIDDIDNKEKAFYYACLEGNLNIINWIFCDLKFAKDLILRCQSLGKITEENEVKDLHCSMKPINDMMYNIMLPCLAKGHLDVVKWLSDYPSRNDIDRKDILVSASESGNLELVKWVYINLGPMSEDDITCGFKRACCDGYIEVAKWLFSKGVNHNSNNTQG